MIKKVEFMINVIKFEDNNFLDIIWNKMYWGVDWRNWFMIMVKCVFLVDIVESLNVLKFIVFFVLNGKVK